MRKVNQILMATVAILLTLVLISTSVVSGIFARFVIKKQASTVVGLERFGVSIKLTPNDNLKATEQELSQAGDTISVQFTSDLTMGDTVYDALKVEVTGTPNAKVKFIMSCTVDYDATAYQIPNNSMYGNYANFALMPLGFTIAFADGATNWQYVSPPCENTYPTFLGRDIMIKSVGQLFDKTINAGDLESKYDNSVLTWSYGTEYDPQIPISGKVNQFYMGFDWLSTSEYEGTKRPTNNEDFNNLIANYLAENSNSPIKFKYTFHIEQAN